SSVSLQWGPSRDKVGIAGYEIYVNGIKTYSTTQTTFNISGLQAKQQFTFYVKAKDISGNYSPQSNMVNAATILNGLKYKYYEGNWSSLPDFNKLSFIKAGVSPNTNISVGNRRTQFGFLWEGYITIPVTGTYIFSTYSRDGSKLWLSTYNASSTPLVNNDGVHRAKYASSDAIKLEAGVYPISITYFDQAGSGIMQLYWKCQSLYGDIDRHLIDDQYFKESYTPGGTKPIEPSNLAATTVSYNQIKLTWQDHSNNETGFEIYRSTSLTGTFNIVNTTSANKTTYTDSALSPSTAYYYKILAVNQYGSSAFTGVVSATTSALPAPPAAPTNFKATVKSSSQINLTWTDNSGNETGYVVYRSINDNKNFKQLASLPANSNSYIDSSLFANITYYYKINVIGVGGSKNSSLVIHATTGDNFPVITDLSNRSARYGITTIIPITATDIDGDLLSYTILQKPSFATFTSNSDNTATLTLNPTSSNQGNYNNIQIIVNDNHGGKDTTTFNLTINTNYDPTIDAISDYTLDENAHVNINLTAHDQNSGDVLTWSVNNAPSAYTLTPGANGSATLSLHPNFASAGTYNVQVSVSDGNGGNATQQFMVTVNDVNPSSTVYVRFMDQDAIGTPWNNVTGVTTNNLKDANNNTTGIGLALQTSWFSVSNGGPQTGDNSGVYPDAVLKDYYYFGVFGGPETVTAKLTGLNTSLKYNLTFYAGSVWSGAPDNGTTTYTIGSQTVSLYVQNNTKNTVSLNNIVPAQDGTITFTMAKDVNTPVGYINALVINSVYDDGSAPLAPNSLIAQNNAGNGVLLTWQDLAYNETGYQIYRSTSSGGTFSLITTTGPNATSYIDASAKGNTEYYYKIRAINTHGQSVYTDVVSILTSDRVPQITAISNILMKNDQTLNVSVTANDDAVDHVTLTATGLPPFVTFTDNGNGTGSLNIAPTAGSSGYYPDLTITAKDNSDSSSSTSFNLTVTDNNVASVYLNFSDGSQAGKPWNNLTAYPNTNTVYSNIVDDNNTPTGITVKLLDGF
ncbi:MAG TPA: fibronectin type III domain-containing protein, partial [Parafilimonas sp.]|nr:fibronectin type III domain-containing protein [Parafilimonas sp.]